MDKALSRTLEMLNKQLDDATSNIQWHTKKLIESEDKAIELAETIENLKNYQLEKAVIK